MPVPQINLPEPKTSRERYVSVDKKFLIGHCAALLWVVFSVIISLPWLNDLSQLISKPLAILVIAGIGYIPGYINAFVVVSLLLDRQPSFITLNLRTNYNSYCLYE